jgi:DNA-binding NarL/FixJ family response regulator
MSSQIVSPNGGASPVAPILSHPADSESRQSVRCIQEKCRLVQYQRKNGLCRRCGATLPAPNEVPREAPQEAPQPEPMSISLKSRLTPKELAISKLLASGCDIPSIAEKFQMSRQTTKNWLNGIYAKFGITRGSKLVILGSMLFMEARRQEVSAGGAPTDGNHCGRQLSQILTTKEMVVVRCIAEGMTNKEIAQELGTKKQAINDQGKSIMKKLGFSNRLEVALRFHHEVFYARQAVSR